MAWIVPIIADNQKMSGRLKDTRFIPLLLGSLMFGLLFFMLYGARVKIPMISIVIFINLIIIILGVAVALVFNNSRESKLKNHYHNSEHATSQQRSRGLNEYSKPVKSCSVYCVYCGFKTNLSARFCPKCGNRME